MLFRSEAGREGTQLMTVSDVDVLKVEASINEVDVASLFEGMNGRCNKFSVN